MGVDCKVPTQLPQGYSLESVATIDNRILQVIYEQDGDTLTYRTGLISENETEISGDYNEYDTETDIELDEILVTLRGEQKEGEEKWYSGFWNEGEMRYAFFAQRPLDTQEVENLLAGLE
ncbi:hypothetical protein LJC49_08150 [Ruminococcaceae bacterium OttesenSCG-928-I18]|nr:hypothetical protein [Ruminococcaceae bacterium OttesenSCG-928-I18]